MDALAAAGWGLAGGLCVEALALYSLIRNSRQWSWRRPIPQGLTAFIISVIARAGAGALLAAAAVGSGQVSGTLAAFGLGVATPLAVEKLSRAIPLTSTLSTDDCSPTLNEPDAAKHSPREESNRPTADADSDGAVDAR